MFNGIVYSTPQSLVCTAAASIVASQLIEDIEMSKVEGRSEK